MNIICLFVAGTMSAILGYSDTLRCHYYVNGDVIVIGITTPAGAPSQ